MKIYNTSQFEKLNINQIKMNDLPNIKRYCPTSETQLQSIIKERIENEGYNCDLNDIDVSNIKDMSYLFYRSDFNGNISEWDVSNVTNMDCTFYSSDFNGDISEWDISNVENMDHMFAFSKFNGYINDWNVSSVTNMDGLFLECKYFNQPLDKWHDKISQVRTMDKTFYQCCVFDQDLSSWTIDSKKTHVYYIFCTDKSNKLCNIISEEHKPKII